MSENSRNITIEVSILLILFITKILKMYEKKFYQSLIHDSHRKEANYLINIAW